MESPIDGTNISKLEFPSHRKADLWKDRPKPGLDFDEIGWKKIGLQFLSVFMPVVTATFPFPGKGKLSRLLAVEKEKVGEDVEERKREKEESARGLFTLFR